MDDIVKAALAKWPDVPHCHGWLELDARGQWLVGPPPATGSNSSAPSQAAPARKQAITNPGIIAFINRHYLCDDSGAWYFQNGPQRVYVELACAPFVWRLHPAELRLIDHTGDTTAKPSQIVLDTQGRFFIEAGMEAPSADPRRIGVLDDRDVAALTHLLCDTEGQPLTDDALDERIALYLAKPATEQPGLWLRWPDCGILPVRPMDATEVARHFGFRVSAAQ